jgi:hypothetical protein
MPIPYQLTVYGCRFKCGARRARVEDRMAAHEAKCWKNPENRTCLTCRHEILERGYPDSWDEPGEPAFRECKAGHFPERVEDPHYIDPHLHYRPVEGCAHWELKP